MSLDPYKEILMRDGRVGQDYADYRAPITQTDALLKDREKTHGDWLKQASCSRALKTTVLDYEAGCLSIAQVEAIEMILMKISRIVCGDPTYKDHWDDIIGYAQLGRDS